MNFTTDERNNTGQNFGLNADGFDALLKRLQVGDESLFEIIFKTHFEKCRTFLIRKLGADSDVAYDITLETLIKFRKNLMLGKIKYGNMAALFTIDARNSYLRHNEKETKYEHVSVDTQGLQILDEDEPKLDMDLVNNLKRALTTIGNDCFELLNSHYYLGMPLRTIAEKRLKRGDEKFINEAAVKTKVAECRKKLKSLLS